MVEFDVEWGHVVNFCRNFQENYNISLGAFQFGVLETTLEQFWGEWKLYTVHPPTGRWSLAEQLAFTWRKNPNNCQPRIKCWRISLLVWKAFRAVKKEEMDPTWNPSFSAYIFILFSVRCGCFRCKGFFLCVSCFFGAIKTSFISSKFTNSLKFCWKVVPKFRDILWNCPSLEVELIANGASSEHWNIIPYLFLKLRHNKRPLHPKMQKNDPPSKLNIT